MSVVMYLGWSWIAEQYSDVQHGFPPKKPTLHSVVLALASTYAYLELDGNISQQLILDGDIFRLFDFPCNLKLSFAHSTEPEPSVTERSAWRIGH